jgi:terminase small subunit-like protein
MSAGRPSLYRAEYAERVIEFCRDGYTLTAFAGEIGVARSTINEWIDAHPEFSEAVSRAKALRARWWEERAREIAEKGGAGGQATIVIFGLKNHAPDDFREKSETVLSGGDKPLQVEQLTPDERAAKARAIVAEAFAAHPSG